MSGAEVLGAIGLASNLIQFIEVAIKIYKSAHGNLGGLSDSFRSIGDLTGTLSSHTAAVASSVEKSTAEEDQRLVRIAGECQRIADDLLRTLNDYQVSNGARFRNVALAAKAIRGAWNKSKIRETEELLDKYHKQLVSHMVFSCKKRLDELSDDARASAANTTELVQLTQLQHTNMDSSFRRVEMGLADMNLGFRSVESRLDAILSRPTSPVPPYEAGQPKSQVGSHPVILGPHGQVEARSMPLHEAALKRDTKSIYRILRMDGVSINAIDDDGQTALHISILGGDFEFCKGLLREDGVDINAMDNDRSTPLHYAVKEKQTKIVSLLLQHGARTDIPDIEGMNAAGYAEQNTPIMWMLSKGASQQSKDEALLDFAKKRNIEAVEEMLAIGAKAQAHGECGNRALMYGAMHGNVPIIKAVCANDKSSLNETNSAGKTALMLAVINGHQEAVEVLLSQSPNLGVKDDVEGRTALFNALAHAHGFADDGVDTRWTIADALLKAGANIETRDKASFRPLGWFCKTGKFSAVHWLVSKGANVNHQKGGSGNTPLMEAAACQDDVEGACRAIDHLIDHGADTEIWHKHNGRTALWEASACGNIRQVEALLRRGAHVNTMSKVGTLPLVIACSKGHEDVVRALLENGSYVKTRDSQDRMAINHASQHKHLGCVKLLLQYGSPVSVQNEHLWSPLHEAAFRNQYDLMRLLLEHNIAVDLRTDEGETALHMASKLTSPRCARMLLQHGASPSLAKRTNGWTPLDEASSRGLTETIKLLLEAGANPNAASSRHGSVRQYTPLMHAAREGKLEACEVLVAGGANVKLRNASGETAYQIVRRYPQVQAFLGQCQLKS